METNETDGKGKAALNTFLDWIRARGKHSYTDAQTEQWMNRQRKIRREKNKIARKCRKLNRRKQCLCKKK